MIYISVVKFAILLLLSLSSVVSSEKADNSNANENYASDLYYLQKYPYGLEHYQLEQNHGVPSFTAGFGSFLKRQDGFAEDSAGVIAIVAVALLGIGGIGAFGVAQALQDQREDIDSNDSDISTLQTRTNGACNALNIIGNVGTVTTAGDATANAVAINAIITAANGANCT